MGATTGIAWTQSTWNPWYGCTKISPGCKNCYMYRDQRQYGGNPFEVRRSKTTFREPLRWKDGRRIFTCSWSDFFIDQADLWRPEAWEVIRQTPRHSYLVLTKRPERIKEHLPKGWPWPHVWLGVSIESRAYLWRADVLRRIPVVGRFLSLEPLLEDLGTIDLTGIGWVIVGGESGRQPRLMAPEWVRSIRNQCLAADIPFFFKQWGGSKRDKGGHELEGRLWQQVPDFERSPQRTSS
jgi:protein gp37